MVQILILDPLQKTSTALSTSTLLSQTLIPLQTTLSTNQQIVCHPSHQQSPTRHSPGHSQYPRRARQSPPPLSFTSYNQQGDITPERHRIHQRFTKISEKISDPRHSYARPNSQCYCISKNASKVLQLLPQSTQCTATPRRHGGIRTSLCRFWLLRQPGDDSSRRCCRFAFRSTIRDHNAGVRWLGKYRSRCGRGLCDAADQRKVEEDLVGATSEAVDIAAGDGEREGGEDGRCCVGCVDRVLVRDGSSCGDATRVFRREERVNDFVIFFSL